LVSWQDDLVTLSTRINFSESTASAS